MKAPTNTDPDIAFTISMVSHTCPLPTFPGFFANQLLASVDSHGQVSFSYD